MPLDILLSIMAVTISFVSIIVLIGLAKKRISGDLNVMINWLIAGIFFGVFIHAVVEVFGVFHLIDERSLLPIMSILISLGSVCFILAVVVGVLKISKQ